MPYRDKGQVVTETGVLQLASQSGHMTAVGRDFLLQPVDPGAAGVKELRDDGKKTLQREKERIKKKDGRQTDECKHP